MGLRGDNPEKLPLININPTQVQQRTIAGNLANAPAAFELANLANIFSTEQLLQSLEAMLPGFGQMRDQITEVLGSKLRGELSRDERNFLSREAAERGVALGTSGSQFETFDELRNVGLRRHMIQNEGLSQAAAWIRSIPQAPLMDFTKMFWTPQQVWENEFRQAQANKPIEWLNNQIDALPSNIERAAAGFLDWAATTGTSVLNMGLGNIMGGKGFTGGPRGGEEDDGGGGGGGGGYGELQQWRDLFRR